MSEWRECELGEVAEIQTGPFGSQLHASDYIENGIPSIMPTNIGNRLEINEKGIACIKYDDARRLSKYLVREGDIVYSRRGDVEKCAYISNKQHGWLCGTGCLRIRAVSDKILAKYCAYYLSTDEMKQWILSSAVGTTMPNLNSSVLQKLPVQYPPLPEQKAIAGSLSCLDDKIDLFHRQNKTLEGMAEALWRKMFVEEAKETWITASVKDMINILSGFAFKSSDFVDSGKYRLITIKNVQDGYLDLSRTDYLSVIPEGMPDYCFLQNGDILLSLTGNVGRCCLVNEEDLLLNQRVAKLQARNVRDSAFTYIMFRKKAMRSILEELAKGTAQANLSPVETARYEIQIPPQDLLENYSEEATPLIEKVLNNFNHIRTLSRLRDTLLPKLMSGEVRVKI